MPMKFFINTAITRMIEAEMSAVYGQPMIVYNLDLLSKIEVKVTKYLDVTSTDEERSAIENEQLPETVQDCTVKFSGVFGNVTESYVSFSGKIRLFSTSAGGLHLEAHHLKLTAGKDNYDFVYKEGIIHGKRTQKEKIVSNPCAAFFDNQPSAGCPIIHRLVFGKLVH